MAIISKSALIAALPFLAIGAAASVASNGNLRGAAVLRDLSDQTAFVALGEPEDSPVDSNIILSIVEDKCCDADWVAFTDGELDAYHAISEYVLNNNNDNDIRSEYGAGYQSAQTWLDFLANSASMASVASSVKDTCDDTCFQFVSNQLQTEIDILFAVSSWNQAYNHLNDQIAYVMHSAMTFAYTNLEMSSQQQKVYNPYPAWPSWLSPVINLATLAAQFLGPLGAPVDVANIVTLSAKTAQYVINTVEAGQSSTTTGNTNFAENDMIDLTYAYLYENVTQTYLNMDSVAGNQAAAISSNWGRLQAFKSDVYGKGVIPSDSKIDGYLNNNTAMYEWTAFEWLMSSKYQICMDQNYGFASPTCNSNSVNTKVSHSDSNAQCEFINTNPRGPSYPPIISWESDPVHVYTWVCDETNAKNTMPNALMNTLNTNTYANQNGLVKNGNFADTILNACSNTLAKNCTAANITLNTAYLGRCGYGNSVSLPATCKSVPR